MATSVRHKTRALLRAHLAAASGLRHVTWHCAVCRQLQLLATEPAPYGEESPQAVFVDESPAGASQA
ncbi:DUF6274 family protein [Streptomyces sp. NPDC052051]|uniref:DUF6274 family protein n=1 Tax=Streptomyces sp. NPDC052051 TaxID=3154649 RepID=UPI0034430FD6